LEPEGTSIVHLQEVAMRYGNGAEALTAVDLRLAPGSFSALMGPSGAGKTSLLRVLALDQPVCRGRILLFGRDATGLDRAETTALQRRIGVVFQDFRLLDELSAFENVALPLRLAGAEEGQVAGHVGELLAWLGLGEARERRPSELSMGQRQLVAFGRAVIGRPSLLLADEPTSSVDAATSRRLLHLLQSLNRLGTTVVLATHNERMVRQHGFPVLRMADGRLAVTAAPAAMAACA
jgi:cell division transport system ATP-binding protein